ncbi:MAG: hypothetical protein LQ338_005938 [Usnochroma carphineum]|nr:MAG: hypothetical protein LQ338_005938 [Usnochroma carphineum]
MEFPPCRVARPYAFAHLQLNLLFSPTLFLICRQMRQEASALLPEPLALQLVIDSPKRYDSALNPERTPFILPGLLDRALFNARIFPLRRCEIRMRVHSGSDDGMSVNYKWLIHHLVDTVQRFPALEELQIEFKHVCSQTPPPPERRMLRSEKLKCLGQLRGFKKVEITGYVVRSWAEALELWMQRPKLFEGSDEEWDQDDTFVCRCKQERSTS